MFKIKMKFRYNVIKYGILFNLKVMPIWLKSCLYKSNYDYVFVYELKNIRCNYWAFMNSWEFIWYHRINFDVQQIHMQN